jgi:hypothetical protein
VKKLPLASLGLILTAITLGACTGQTYTNSAFGFSVDVPAGTPTCRSEPTQPDHGLDMFLDSGPDGCEKLQTRPYLGVYAEYNAAMSPTPDAVLDGLNHLKGIHRGAAPELQIPKRPSAVARVDRDDGWVEIWVVTQAWNWPPPAEESDLSYVNYIVTLNTTPQRLERDLPRLRTLLRRIKIVEPKR